MSVLIRAGILALGAVLLIPSGSARGEAAPQETLLLVVEAPSAKETITVLRDGDAQEEDFETYLTQVVLSEMPADFATEALKAQAVAARTFCAAADGGRQARGRGRLQPERLLSGLSQRGRAAGAVWRGV